MYSRHIESFIETANAGSFSKAARALYIAPSSLIQQIDLLEQRLGIVLFERGRRGIKLHRGRRIALSRRRRDRPPLRRGDRPCASNQNDEEPIRVATSLLMKCRMLPGIWSHMIERAPGTRIDIISLESAGGRTGQLPAGTRRIV